MHGGADSNPSAAVVRGRGGSPRRAARAAPARDPPSSGAAPRPGAAAGRGAGGLRAGGARRVPARRAAHPGDRRRALPPAPRAHRGERAARSGRLVSRAAPRRRHGAAAADGDGADPRSAARGRRVAEQRGAPHGGGGVGAARARAARPGAARPDRAAPVGAALLRRHRIEARHHRRGGAAPLRARRGGALGGRRRAAPRRSGDRAVGERRSGRSGARAVTADDGAARAALRDFIDAHVAGEAPDVDAFCAARPALAPALRAAIEDFLSVERGLGAMRPGAGAAAGPPVERTIGDFRILRELGRGGMGVVYDAEQVSLKRRVALKVLAAHVTLRRESVERFQREASTAARLKHPGIVEVYTVGEHDGTHYFAMERVEGEPLDRVLERARAERRAPSSGEEIRAAARVVLQIAEALAYAHESGVLHRDVKPSNVLLRPDGSAVLTDFGLAREESLESLTASGELVGTPHYVSPERATGGAASEDARSDLFALGVTLYECLSLRRPFEGPSAAAVLANVVRKEPEPLRSANPAVPRDLATIAHKLLQKSPADRYPSAGAA